MAAAALTPDEIALLMERPEIAEALGDYAEWLVELTREPGRYGRYESVGQGSRVRTVHWTFTKQLDG